MTLITADQQTAGRGRLDHQWLSPIGNLYLTFCFFIEANQLDHSNNQGNIPQILALSVVQVLKQLNFTASLKWPNDILLANKKLGGILCETSWLDTQFAIILGLGLNVNMSLTALELLKRPAISLRAEDGQLRKIEPLIQLIQKNFTTHLIHFLTKGFAPFLDTYKTNLVHQKGDMLSFHHHQQIITGYFDSIDSSGALVLKLANHQVQTYHTGEIINQLISKLKIN